MNRRYAERTKVPVERSRTEIEAMLSKHGCDSTAVFNDRQGVWFAFTHSKRAYRIGIVMPQAGTTGDDQERRRRMRSLALYIKARLNAVEDGIKSFDAEFMPERMVADGRTTLEHYTEQAANLEGVMPTRLMLTGGKS